MMAHMKTIFDLVDEEQEIKKQNKEEPKENIEQINIEEEIKTNPRIKNLKATSTLFLVAGTISTAATLSMIATNFGEAETTLTGLISITLSASSLIVTKQEETETQKIKEQYEKIYSQKRNL